MTIPSVAKHRYRIRRKLGEGGMGAERQGEAVARIRHVRVHPLALEESIELVRSLLTRPDRVPRALLEQVAAEAAGSPFLLEAFAHHQPRMDPRRPRS